MLRNWFNISKAVGFILTITGLMLGWYFVQVVLPKGPAPLESFVVAAMAVMMVSVGIRYVLKTTTPKTPKADKATKE